MAYKLLFFLLVYEGDEMELKAESSRVVDDDDDPENRYDTHTVN